VRSKREGAAAERNVDIGRKMNTRIELRFESRLDASPEAVWKWITSVQGISAEMWPFFRMTVPHGVYSLADVDFRPGVPLFRSRVFLLGFVPIGYSDLTLLQLVPGEGFVEQSPTPSMKLWRHERRLSPAPARESGVVLSDRLTFEPRWAPSLVSWFIERVFQHRHAVLRSNFGSEG
jgi:ligand-binding SRPBCC domain-containing protein